MNWIANSLNQHSEFEGLIGKLLGDQTVHLKACVMNRTPHQSLPFIKKNYEYYCWIPLLLNLDIIIISVNYILSNMGWLNALLGTCTCKARHMVEENPLESHRQKWNFPFMDKERNECSWKWPSSSFVWTISYPTRVGWLLSLGPAHARQTGVEENPLGES